MKQRSKRTWFGQKWLTGRRGKHRFQCPCCDSRKPKELKRCINRYERRCDRKMMYQKLWEA